MWHGIINSTQAHSPPHQRRQTDIGERGKLVALAQVGIGLARRTLPDPRLQRSGCIKIL